MNTETIPTLHPQTVEIPEPLEIHPSVSEKAARLLLKVADILAQEPSRYNQFVCSLTRWECGSPCCIIGHMMALTGVRTINPTVPRSSFGESLGLTFSQWRNIYWVQHWPTLPEDVIPTPTEGIARIEHFLRTGE